jgi:hypothetical protein
VLGFLPTKELNRQSRRLNIAYQPWEVTKVFSALRSGMKALTVISNALSLSASALAALTWAMFA